MAWQTIAKVCVAVVLGAFVFRPKNYEPALRSLAIENATALHPLSRAERSQFERDGFLVLPDVLSEEELRSLHAAMDDWTGVMGGVEAGTTWHGYMFSDRHHIPLKHADLVRLVVHPRVLAKVIGVLGWNIWLYHSHAVDTRASPIAPLGALSVVPAPDHWHQDSGRVNLDIEGEPRPRLSVKVSFFLTDTRPEDAPQFWVVPGSHMNNSLPAPIDDSGLPIGAMRLPVAPGTAVMIDRRLWHTGPLGEQSFAHSRRVLFYGYGPRWMRPKDPMSTEKTLAFVQCPVIRQLLGHTPSYNGLYSPTPTDAPLLPWLVRHGLVEPPSQQWEDCSQSSKWIGGCA